MSASVVILTDDPKLRDECVTALRSLGDDEPRHRFVTNTNQLFEALRTQSVELVLAEFTTQPKELNALARQVATASADTAFAAILRPEGFPESVSESAVLIDAMRCGVCDFLRRPISTADLRRLLQARSDNALSHPSATPKHGRVVTFISNKGGVGKSTLSTNVAVAAARYKKLRVLLIDGSLQMGVAAAMLDLRP
jgi:pilus assembly protein CpaE